MAKKVVSSIDKMAQKAKGMFEGGMDENTKNDMEDVVARGTEKGMENYKKKKINKSHNGRTRIYNRRKGKHIT